LTEILPQTLGSLAADGFDAAGCRIPLADGGGAVARTMPRRRVFRRPALPRCHYVGTMSADD